MSPWNWSPERTEGIWRYGPASIRPFVSASPWITIGLLLLMFWYIGGTLVAEKGVLFDLPSEGQGEGESTGSVAMIVPGPRSTLVFFDDSRYLLDDANSLSALSDHLAEMSARPGHKTMLALVDRRISHGEVMTFVNLARKRGVEKVLVAEKKEGGEE